jgi:hypothetical protein
VRGGGLFGVQANLLQGLRFGGDFAQIRGGRLQVIQRKQGWA